MTVAFVSPRATTSTTHDCAQKASSSAGASIAVAIRSRSRTVSRNRRAEPAIDTCTAAGCSLSASATATSRGSAVPSSARGGPSRLRLRKRGQDLLLGLRAEPGDVAQLVRLGSRAQPSDRRDPELLPDPARGLRPEPGSRRKRTSSSGTAAFRFVSACISPSSTTWTIFSSIVLPIPCSSFARPSSASSRPGRLSRGSGGGAPVGADPEGVGAVELDQVGEQVELVGELAVPGQRRAPRTAIIRAVMARPSACPTYNERENLEPMVRALGERAARRRPRARDRRQLAGRDGRARRRARGRAAVRRRAAPRRARRGSGPRTSRASARALADGAELVLEMDCDFSHDPEDVPRLIAAAEAAPTSCSARATSPGGGDRRTGASCGAFDLARRRRSTRGRCSEPACAT